MMVFAQRCVCQTLTRSRLALAPGRRDLAVTRMRRREVIEREGYFHL